MKIHSKISLPWGEVWWGVVLFFLLTGCSGNQTTVETTSIPYLKQQGTATQLMVHDEPLLMLGGELGNSTAADAEKIKEVFPQLKQMRLNTVLAPVYWELMEPEEGTFNFELIDVMLQEARKENMKLVLLWFGSWKNSMSCYAPAWVKNDRERFPYVQKSDGKSVEIMTAFSDENLQTDKKAFVALMNYLKKADSKEHTVVMVQVENEIGMIPEARDRIAKADELFESEVPATLIDYLNKNKTSLQPHIQKKWATSGYATQGNWESIFGKDIYTDEIFQAWNFATYVEEITKAGKEVYDLPMFVNTALNTREREPGAYPSGGPLDHLLDIWKAGAPSIDFLAPDIYDPPFDFWSKKYDIKGANPLFIPETLRGNHTAARVFYAFGAHDAMGFCPFSIESTSDPLAEPLVKSYYLLDQLTPLLTSVQGMGKTSGCWFHPSQLRDTITMGEYVFHISHDYTLGWSAGAGDPKEKWPETGCLIVKLTDNEFVVAGTGVVIRCYSKQQAETTFAGILSCDKGRYENGKWIPQQRLNGDETHQGRHVRIPFGDFDIQHFELYKYE